MLDKRAIDILYLLKEDGYEAFIVGGSVRDFLLGIPSKDYDITTNAKSDDIIAVLKNYRCYQTGKNYGTVSVFFDDIKIEITPYRTDGIYVDHRHPINVAYTGNILEDLKRRDFTINAICFDGEKIYDPLNGVTDLNNKIIKSIGNADTRFNEDALRILRAIRFKCKLGFEIDDQTECALFKNKELLCYISAERKKDELFKMLGYQNISSIIDKYNSIIELVFPINKERIKDIDLFSTPLSKLAYMGNNISIIDLKSYAFSTKEANIIKHLNEIKDVNINSDEEIIRILSNLDFFDISRRFIEEKYKCDLSVKIDSLRDYLACIKNINIKSSELQEMGFFGKGLRDIQEKILENIHNKRIKNTHGDIVRFLTSCRLYK